MGLLGRLNKTKRTLPESLRHPTLIELMKHPIGPLFPRDESILVGMRGAPPRRKTKPPIREPHKGNEVVSYTIPHYKDYRKQRKNRNKIAKQSRRRNRNG